MRSRKARFGVAAVGVGAAIAVLTGCTSDNASSTEAYKETDAQAKAREPQVYHPVNDVEFNNYNDAQKLYDDPNTIIWCTTAWTNPSAPLVTYPIRGKLTSSSVSFYPNQELRNGDTSRYNPELRSVDGMYHGSPPPYRYGFTPGGQYVEFNGMEVNCTTALTKFQREQTTVSLTVDGGAQNAQQQAEDALKAGDPAKAQQILEQQIGVK